MAIKRTTQWRCSECGKIYPKWQGFCNYCGERGTLIEEPIPIGTSTGKTIKITESKNEPLKLSDVPIAANYRIDTGFNELNRVLGGGLVSDSAVLIGGDPGIGKSTLLLQICPFLAKEGKVLYITGEESASQIKIRADRLGVKTDSLYILAENDLTIIQNRVEILKPKVIIVDSIQTVYSPEIVSSAGSVSQVKEATSILTKMAKHSKAAIFIVGHVTKDGNIAGPKVLEHLVDTVLYFEGDRYAAYRILRAVKNRFGSTNEIGVFEMQDKGFVEIDNPSALFLDETSNESGCCVSCTIEGSRPILIEIQALLVKSAFGTPRRMTTGIDYNKMAMITAVLEKKFKLYFAGYDAYLNVVGGLKVSEPSVDLAIALAEVSSFINEPIPSYISAIGEISLTGDIRGVSNISSRINEAEHIGYKEIIIPFSNYQDSYKKKKIKVIPAKNVLDAIKYIYPDIYKKMKERREEDKNSSTSTIIDN